MSSESLKNKYIYKGKVQHGKGLGHTLDFPTANLIPEEGAALPAFGVYFSKVDIEGNKYFGVTNVGTRPTVASTNSVTVETCILEFDEDIYGKEIVVELLEFMRPEMKFEGPEALKNQVLSDKSRALEKARNQKQM